MKLRIKFLDLFEKRVHLSFNKEISYKTTFGAIMTIITAALGLIITLIYLNGFFKSHNFIIIGTTTMNINPKYDFTNMPFLFTLDNCRDPVFIDGDYLDIKLVMTDMKVYMNPISEETDYSYVETPIETVKCENLKGEYYDYLRKSKNIYDLKYYLCIKPGQNLTFYGNFANMVTGFRGIRAYVTRCNNDTLKERKANYTCKSKEEIDKAIDGVRFAYYYLGYKIDHFSRKNYLNFDVLNGIKTIIPNHPKAHFTRLSQGKYVTDKSIFFHNQESKNFYYLSSIDYDADISPYIFYSSVKYEDYLGIYNFYLDNTKFEYYRRYEKFGNILAQIGGIYNLLIVIMRIISNFISRKQLDYDIIDKLIFNLPEMKMSIPNNNNIELNRPMNLHLSHISPGKDIRTNILHNINNSNNMKNNIKIISPNINKNLKVCKEAKNNLSINYSYNNIINKSESNLISIDDKINKKILYSCLKNILKEKFYYYLCPVKFLKRDKKISYFFSVKKRLYELLSLENLFQVIKEFKSKENFNPTITDDPPFSLLNKNNSVNNSNK